MKKIACTYENGEIFQHFGHTEQFKIYEIDNHEIKSAEIVGSEGNGHGALAGFLKNLGVDILICGGIGDGAKKALDEAGIELYAGIIGEADMVVKAYLNGSLVQSSNSNCSHHAESNGKEHSCHSENSNSCGAHSCGGNSGHHQ